MTFLAVHAGNQIDEFLVGDARGRGMAVDASGQRLAVPVENEETGRVERVSTWGLRVDKSVFDAIAADKKDDGIIQDNVFGEKPRGVLMPAYNFPTTGDAITEW